MSFLSEVKKRSVQEIQVHAGKSEAIDRIVDRIVRVIDTDPLFKDKNIFGGQAGRSGTSNHNMVLDTLHPVIKKIVDFINGNEG